MPPKPVTTPVEAPRERPRVPSYRLHRHSGQAVVTLNGCDFYCGRFDEPESRAEYERLIGLWLANGRKLPDEALPAHRRQATAAPLPVAPLTVNALCDQYEAHAVGAFAHRREPEKILRDVRAALALLREQYGTLAALNFGPKALKALRAGWIAAGLGRKTVNERTRVVKAAFKWATSEELVPPSTWHALSAVTGLRRGDSDAREPEKVRPVPSEYVAAVLPHLSPTVRAMVELQAVTGCRSGELVILRTRDVDTSGDVWAYRPQYHKGSNRGLDRVVELGPKAQAILAPWLRLDVDAYCFSPRRAVADARRARSAARRTPLNRGNTTGTHRVRRPKRRPGERYDVDTYRRAVQRGCDAADRAARKAAGQPACETCRGRGELREPKRHACPNCGGAGRVGDRLVPLWFPHQLRHNRATELAKVYGIEVARVMLGHQHVGVTELYSERDRAVALRVAREVG